MTSQQRYRANLYSGTVYRGTQHHAITGVRKALSFAYSLPVAIIWSSRPGDVWGRTKPKFLSTSTVHIAQINVRNPFVWDQNHMTMGDVLRDLGYGKRNGITEDEVTKIYNYMHKRTLGQAQGGDFGYKLVDEEGNERDESEVPLSFSHPESMISLAREDWVYDPTLDTADLLSADTFIFVDAPAVQRAVLARGFDVMVYVDIFQGGEDAAKELLGCDVTDLDLIDEGMDLKDDWQTVHDTVRILDPAVVVEMSAVPTASLLDRRYC
jgi:hypothetical protein